MFLEISGHTDQARTELRLLIEHMLKGKGVKCFGTHLHKHTICIDNETFDAINMPHSTEKEQLS